MPAGKFSAIIGKVTDHVSLHMSLDDTAKLTFEVSDGIVPMQLYQASSVEARDDRIEVSLTPRVSSCKPRDRWLATQIAASCGGSSASGCCA